MKTIENVTIYKCDFCKKELKRKHAMENHEIKCNCNPLNSRACTNGCTFLEREIIDVDFEIRYDYENGETQYSTKQVNAFKCTKFDKLMYPFSIEKSNALEKHPETFEYQEPMPKECDSFKDDTVFLDSIFGL
jgi:hypothetical protein